MSLHLTRRAALFAGLAAAWAIPNVVAAQDAVLTWTPKGVSMTQARTLAAACERIMPATATPGAGALGVPQFVDRAIATWCSRADADSLLAGLNSLETDAQARFGVSYTAATAAQQDALLSESKALRLLRDLATTGYFQSEIAATQVLRYDPVPGEYRGCVPLKEIGRAWAT